MPAVDFRLYLVTDRGQVPDGTLLSVLAQYIASGGPAIQLRERDLSAQDQLSIIRAIQRLIGSTPTKLLINDRLDLVLSTSTHGVHLREDSLSAAVARRIAGPDRLIGVSTHSVDGVIQADAQGADFAVLGPIYETPSKRQYGSPLGLDVLEQACRIVRMPVFAIGGISPARARAVRQAGAFGVAVISSILCAADAAAATRELLSAVNCT
jgi:thiamine-phosphate pyrophosphorylase